MVGEQSTATGKTMKVWYGESRGILKGDVRIVSQNSGDSPGQKEEPTVILCEELEYSWKSEEGVAKGGVKMRQGIKRAFSDRAEIYQKRNEVLLIGNVRVEQGDGDWLTASRAIYDTGDQTVRAEGRVVAKTRLEPEEEDPVAAGPPAKKSLPQPMLAEPAYQLLPMRDLPVVPLPWLDQKTAPVEP
jgi:lipopolysaccharide assembly outer membrane protein LptD (OstA)